MSAGDTAKVRVGKENQEMEVSNIIEMVIANPFIILIVPQKK